MKTAVVRIKDLQFFTFQDFKNHYKNLDDKHKPSSKNIYYSKGLGSNDDKYAYNVMCNLKNHIVSFTPDQDKDIDKNIMELAFGSKGAD